MAIYRGTGGSGDATSNVTVNEVAQYSADAEASATDAAASATSASASASTATTQATNAATSASNASTSETNAATSETNAATSATNAATSATTATTQATNASTSATAAQTAQTAAETAQAAAETAETNAETAETNAATSATNAATSATSASTSATTATTKASEASTSATNAATSESNASTSETNAATSATNAATSETNAATSATAAASSASAASTSETNAGISETNAATSASNAATSETNAATSASTATTQATAAATSATNAATSATSASNSATASANSATAAATSATNAAASAASAAAVLDNFDDRYLGAKASDPSVDNDGDALEVGSLYFNTTDNEMRIYTASGWIAASSASVETMDKYKFTATSGQTVFSGSDDGGNTLALTVGVEIVTLNGIVLEQGTDYTATTSAITLTTGATTSDELNVFAFGNFTVADTVSKSSGGTFQDNVTVDGNLVVNDNVGIGTSSPSAGLHVETDVNPVARFSRGTNNTTNANWYYNTTLTGQLGASSGGFEISAVGSSKPMQFYTNGSERMSIDSSGNVLVGTTDAFAHVSSSSGEGVSVSGQYNVIYASRSGGELMQLNRQTSDGEIIRFRKDGSTVGSIGTAEGRLVMGTGDTGFYYWDGGDGIIPWNIATNNGRDNVIDLGNSSNRFDDIYATNGTIQTSDRNEKQDIASLTSTEMNVAKRISAMFKKFRWIDSVEEKGDDARIHSGVIAQDVQQAFADEGLDAGDYALFISTTWWETQTDVPAVEAVDEVLDDDGNVVTEAVEAKDAYTRTDIYNTAEEAPEGATERTRMGIRYPHLLSFLAAYNEQRFSAIEARLDSLENN